MAISSALPLPPLLSSIPTSTPALTKGITQQIIQQRKVECFSQLGKTLTALREKSQYNKDRRAAAKAVRISPLILAALETGKLVPTATKSHLQRLANLYNLELKIMYNDKPYACDPSTLVVDMAKRGVEIQFLN